MPKNVIKFPPPPIFTKFFPVWRPQVGIESVSENISPVFLTKFPPFGHFFIPVSNTLLSPFWIHFFSCFGYTFCPCFRYTFYPCFRCTVYPSFRYPFYLRFCSRPFQAISTTAPNAAMHSLYCALSPTSEQETTPAPDAAMHLCTVPCPQRQNRTQHQRIRMYSSPLV